MALFRRKRKERPKNSLGVALYDFDNLVNRNFKKVKEAILKKRKINPKKVKKIYERNLSKLDYILEDISKENLKVDYRSDKTRYKIIDLIEKFKKFLEEAIRHGFDYEKIEEKENIESFKEILEKREKLKKDMKEIDSDYL